MAAFSPFAVALDADLLVRYRTPGAAYRCYPSPDRFVEEFDADAFTAWADCRSVGALRRGLVVSLQGPRGDQLASAAPTAATYEALLLSEIAVTAPLFRGAGDVASVHCVGEIACYIGIPGLDRLMRALRDALTLSVTTRCSVDLPVDRAEADALAELRAAGFDRLVLMPASNGLELVHRFAAEGVRGEFSEAATLARAAGFRSVCARVPAPLDELPLDGFVAMLDAAIAAAVDHVSVLDPASDGATHADGRTDALAAAIEHLCYAGYVFIGSGCFARAEDEYAVARRRGRLQLSPIGHVLRQDLDVLGFGAGAISAFGSVYSQNQRTLHGYHDRLRRGFLPIERGLQMSPDDLIRRKVIHSLICHAEVSIESIEIAHLVDFGRYFARELEELEPMERLGMIQRDRHWISVEPRGRAFASRISAIFDRHQRNHRSVQRERLV